MAKNKLSAAGYKSALKKPGKHGDGDGLILAVSKGAAGNLRASWIFCYTRDGKRVEMGLGSASPDGVGKGLGLVQARAKRDEMQDLLSRDIDPRRERERVKEEAERARKMADGVPTLYIVLKQVYERDRHKWKSHRHAQDWQRTLTTHLGDLVHRKVDDITPKDVAAALKKLWTERPATAVRALGRVETAMAVAIASEWRRDANPAAKKLVTVLLGDLSKSGKNHRALAYEDAPAFVTDLRKLQYDNSPSALALEFVLLCASRADEVCGAKWEEIDLEKSLWVIPAERMKAGRIHRVPLSARAIAILKTMAATRRNAYVFASRKGAARIRPESFRDVLRRMSWLDRTSIHGLRSTFRDWAGDRTTHAREVAEAALAHAVGDQSEQAYRRGDALEKRRALMEEWCDFLEGSKEPQVEGGNVVKFKAG